jgi:hypothetical protein
MASTETIQKQMSLLPEYQEKYLKDLLANIYQVPMKSQARSLGSRPKILCMVSLL